MLKDTSFPIPEFLCLGLALDVLVSNLDGQGTFHLMTDVVEEDEIKWKTK